MPHLKSNRPVQIWTFSAIAVVCMAVCAQSASAMDLLQVYDAASLQDATILASRSAADVGREKLPQAKAQLLPNIAFSLTQNSNRLVSTSPNALGIEQATNSNYESGNKTLTLRQPLLRTYQFASYSQALAQVDDANATLAQEEQNLAARVSAAYFEAAMTNEHLALIDGQKAAYGTQLDAARKALIAGSGTRTDIDEAQARLDMALALEIEARQNVDFTMRQLRILVNEPIDKITPPDITRLELKALQPDDVQSWVELAELQGPQFQALKAQVEVARRELDKASAGHHPTLDFVAQTTRSESESVTSVASRYTNTTVGVQFNLPLFSGGYVSSTVRQAQAALQRAEYMLEAGRRELGARVHKEYRGVVENVAKVRALEQALRSADQLIVSSKRSLQAGSRTMLDVLNAEQQQLLVKRDLAQARYMYIVSNIRLLALVGQADRDAIAKVNYLMH